MPDKYLGDPHQGIVANLTWLKVEFPAATLCVKPSKLDSPYIGSPAAARADSSAMSFFASLPFSDQPQKRSAHRRPCQLGKDDSQRGAD